jgi:DNA-binding NarL/FixJ family response regulator
MTVQKIPRQVVRVLVVDDAPEMRDLVRMKIRDRDDLEIVGEAGDGLEAIQRVGRLQPDLVICDVQMPGLDGIAAIPHMREAAPSTRILMHSATADDLTVHRAIRAGADSFVVKGASRQMISDSIDDVLARPVPG